MHALHGVFNIIFAAPGFKYQLVTNWKPSKTSNFGLHGIIITVHNIQLLTREYLEISQKHSR